MKNTIKSQVLLIHGNKPYARGKIEELIRFMEMATLPTVSSHQTTLNLSILPLEPPLPHNYLVAWAILSSSSVRMLQVWAGIPGTGTV